MAASKIGGVGDIKKVTLASGGTRFQFPWWEYRTIESDGTTQQEQVNKTGRRETKAEAEALRGRIQAAHLRGERYVAEQDKPVSYLRVAGVQFIAAAVNGNKPQATVNWRAASVNKFLAYMGETALATDLSRERLHGYYESLRALKSAHRYLAAAESFWRWAHKHKVQGIPEPEVISDEISAPPPVVALDAPSWKDIDAMIDNLDRREWHRRVALVLRYTGIRASQALMLERSDVNLDRSVLMLRAMVRGSKGNRLHRAVPLHPTLAAAMATWDLPSSGLIFGSEDSRRKGAKAGAPRTPWREDALWEPFLRAWRLSGVAESKWGAPKDIAGGRDHQRPVHAIRSGFKTELLRAKCLPHIVDLVIGHKSSATHAAYVPEHVAEVGPNWDDMVEVVGKIPIYELPKNAKMLSLAARSTRSGGVASGGAAP